MTNFLKMKDINKDSGFLSGDYSIYLAVRDTPGLSQGRSVGSVENSGTSGRQVMTLIPCRNRGLTAEGIRKIIIMFM